MRDLFDRYADVLLAQVLQSVVCNAFHPMRQRLARWLLMTQDRIGSNELPLTQEYLAQILGVHRSTVIRVARLLQNDGVIRSARVVSRWSEAFAALVADIRENGLREAIVLYEGKVLDGRNRYRACIEVGIEPITKPWDQRGTALSYVISKNLHRRHLNESQRAMVAAKIATMKSGARTDLAPIGARSRGEAAELLNVGVRSVTRAATIRDQGVKELQQAVEAGDVSLWSAVEVARQPQEEQRVSVSR